MYYCVGCQSVHTHGQSDRIFKTGFHTFGTGQTVSIGLCWLAANAGKNKVTDRVTAVETTTSAMMI